MQLPARIRSRWTSWVMAAAVVIVAASCSASEDQPALPYSDLVLRASQGDVVAVVQEGTDLAVTFRGESTPRRVVVSEQLDVWQDLCSAAGTGEAGQCAIGYEFVEPNAAGGMLTLLITALLPLLLIGGFVFFMTRRAPATNRP